MIYDKPYKTLDELIELLITKHHLTIEDPERAKKILSFIPYYDLINGYKECFMDAADQFNPQITFDKLYLFNMFNHGFQNIIFEYSTLIESYFKVVLARAISEAYGVDQSIYLQPKCYLKSRRNINKAKLLENLMKICTTTTDNPTKYYREHHNHIPPWILLKNTTFSNAINWFMLLPRTVKSPVLDEMLPVMVSNDQKIPLLRYILTMVRKLRNILAHGLKYNTFNVQNFGKNLDKAAIRLLIKPSLLSDKELKEELWIYGIYGYIIFSLSIIPDRPTQIRLAGNLLNYLKYFNIAKSSEMDKLWHSLGTFYLQALNLPCDLETRLNAFIRNQAQKDVHCTNLG